MSEEQVYFSPQFNFIKEQIGVKPKVIIDDSKYDSETTIENIVKELYPNH